jgi:hypothetical protein
LEIIYEISTNIAQPEKILWACEDHAEDPELVQLKKLQENNEISSEGFLIEIDPPGCVEWRCAKFEFPISQKNGGTVVIR